MSTISHTPKIAALLCLVIFVCLTLYSDRASHVASKSRERFVDGANRSSFCTTSSDGADVKVKKGTLTANIHVDQRAVISAFDLVACKPQRKGCRSNCLLPAGVNSSDPAGCAMRLLRAAEVACGVAEGLMCRCSAKRVFVVSNVSVVARLDPPPEQGRFHAIIATTYVDAVVNVPHGDGQRQRLLHAIDGSSFEYAFIPCFRGTLFDFDVLGPFLEATASRLTSGGHSQYPRHKAAQPVVDALEAPAKDHVALERNVAELRTSLASLSQWTCDMLQLHPLAHKDAHRDLEHIEVDQPVFYSLHRFSGIAGHALELLVEGIAQYTVGGLWAQRIPWLIPCSNQWVGNVAPLIFTQFFLELNEVLQFSFYPLDIDRFVDVDRHNTRTLVFKTVHFASLTFGRNSLCFKPVFRSMLWPTVLQIARVHGWDGAHTSHTVSNHSCQSNDEVTSSMRSSSPLRIAFLKMRPTSPPARNVTTTVWSPERSFHFSHRFQKFMQERGVVSFDPTMPLLHRMWLVNNAELIVASWGSTLGTVASLLFEPERDEIRSSHNKSRRLRILVLIHPSYCIEAHKVLGVSKKSLCDPKRHRRRSKVVRGKMSRVEGAENDFYGGGDSEGGQRNFFCIHYVFIDSLRHVAAHDFDFMCD
jgi:hypothetical protein